MPPIFLHMAMARDVQVATGAALVGEQPGPFFLGATTPDIRVITRWDRQRTHFFDLSNFEEQSGVVGILGECPDLASPGNLDESTVAFIAGYISHLEMDEAWIIDVYRPCFGERSPLKGDLLANLLDRVLQHELDCREMADRAAAEEVQRDLLASAVEVAVGFIDRDTLLQWREVSAERLSYPPG